MKIISILMTIFILLFFTACGEDNTKWGIDNDSGIELNVCNGDKSTTTNATILKANYTVKPIMENTKILMWHYQNGDKTACVTTGKAIMTDL